MWKKDQKVKNGMEGRREDTKMDEVKMNLQGEKNQR